MEFAINAHTLNTVHPICSYDGETLGGVLRLDEYAFRVGVEIHAPLHSLVSCTVTFRAPQSNASRDGLATIYYEVFCGELQLEIEVGTTSYLFVLRPYNVSSSITTYAISPNIAHEQGPSKSVSKSILETKLEGHLQIVS